MARIYLNSTLQDLKDFREAAYRALLRLRHDVLGMEDHATGRENTLHGVFYDLDRCDIHVGLLAWRYGYIPADGNEARLSIVELAYRRAMARGMPVFMFLLHEDVPWPPRWVDGADDRERIKRFREEVLRDATVSYFRTPDELGSLIVTAIAAWQSREHDRNHEATAQIPTGPPLATGPWRPLAPGLDSTWCAGGRDSTLSSRTAPHGSTVA
jgi:hypothetical protein